MNKDELGDCSKRLNRNDTTNTTQFRLTQDAAHGCFIYRSGCVRRVRRGSRQWVVLFAARRSLSASIGVLPRPIPLADWASLFPL
jgi:hypothetical protein